MKSSPHLKSPDMLNPPGPATSGRSPHEQEHSTAGQLHSTLGQTHSSLGHWHETETGLHNIAMTTAITAAVIQPKLALLR